MQPFWHETSSGRIKVADLIEKLDSDLLERVCLVLEEIEDEGYEILRGADILKPILYIPKAKAINLHEVKLRYRRIQIRIFCSVKEPQLTYLVFWNVNKQGHDWEHPSDLSYKIFEAIQYGNDKKVSKSIKEFDFYPHG